MSEKDDYVEDLFRKLMSEKDDYVEDLLRKSPKAPPMSDLELKRHEKMIRSHIAEMKREQSKKEGSIFGRFQTQFQLAAGFLVVVGGISFATNQGIFDSKNDLVISMPTPEKPGSGSETTEGVGQENSGTSQTPKPKNPDNKNPEGVEEFESGAMNQSDIDKFINNTGLDYLSDIQKAKQLVKISSSPLFISELPQAYGKCAIELGINKELLGIDKGKYDGTNVLAFYYGSSRSTASIWIVEKPCVKLEKL